MSYVFKKIRWEFLVNTVGRSNFLPRKLRWFVYKMAGMKTCTNNIKSGCFFSGDNVILEKGVFLNQNVFLDCSEKVHIKENTWVAFDVLICSSTHQIGENNKRAGQSELKPVTIGEGCWIGARSTILPGVSIGDGCVIAAGSVVNKDCETNGVYAGVPAKRIKDLST